MQTPTPSIAEAVSEPALLRQRWQALRQSQPRTRTRDAAEQLRVSEAQLLATGVGEDAVRLDLRFDVLLPRLESLGRVMSLTRNEHAVHEKRGTWRNVELHGLRGLVLDEDIDLRLFLSRWRFGFALRERMAEGLRRSLQFFDASGTAVHKVYVEDAGGAAAFDALVEELTHVDQEQVLPVERATPPGAPRPDSEVDVDGLRAGWRALKDTHDFFPLLMRLGVARTQALRLVGDELATPVSTESLAWVLERVSASGLPIMVFVGNPGCIQIHTGPVRTVKPMGPWLNVLDPGFNLHVRADHIHAAWVVRKPTRDGEVTSLELFDAAGENIALVFGKRKPGLPELPAWQTLMHELIQALPAREVRS
ncbi:hemin-degrading factor [Pyxidicoccus parkwayensis]|uniref:Hemin-degrading factor n=1 Tax=Pyxidicoccus parkwayensis TaxID=2813578 RepID=A0ABX7NUY0_9BACT|nr:ChuX/HutX family heme-like substrate-binding protein [Pyxidicoccus parkwaysis]QSQ19928.1 hemin-degrading factor [Pyxidicoccus parkwaysis]